MAKIKKTTKQTKTASKSKTRATTKTKTNPCRVIYPRRKMGKGKKARIIRVKRKICY